MFNFFGLFDSKLPPLEQMAKCRQKHNWAGLVRACYRLGLSYMELSSLNQARLWLHRADTIYSADDKVYKKVGKKLIENCSDFIGTLESASLIYNDLPDQIAEKTEDMPDEKIRLWGLLSLARLVNLGNRLASLPGCEALGKLGWAVDTVAKSFRKPLTEREFDGLRDLGSSLYELGDSTDFWGIGSEISVPGGPPFQVFDLNGTCVHLEIDAYLDAHVKMTLARENGEEPPEPETGIIAGALLPDYYVRTSAGRPEDKEKVNAEVERIWKDYEFICSDFTWEQILQKIAEYKEFDILA